ncbi:squalene/phytoene synthase family protein, partial [Neisseria meningitidis]|uniref:squalene/phytoene synthase family protein n=1 Tax=Neisseria meningitidis TaxID=487 RepID=UPI0015D5B062
MSVGHYENFPVGSLILPRRLRKPVHAVYAFARTADDMADEGSMPSEARVAGVGGLRGRVGGGGIC